ncbi:Aspartate/tyrosine/aromatic aminotransferase [Sphingobium yanoikuyae]|uniref:Aspartate/tyrosine/aromatic aminotransferase n=1 Tax=Sphingobium yanoikuyae TaxID=13690 RepID=A0A084EPQ3_SPHYA|nr:Aspartate/tyrosine/aromatic aminotransferase [Sphingobium yanoikuyae]
MPDTRLGHPVYRDMPTTIFEHMSARARETGAINLGQGFPEGPGPQAVLQAAADALLTRSSQYPPMPGLIELRTALADHYARRQGLDLSPQEIIVTSGATEAIAASLLALVRPGDEVLMLAPLYDAYLPLVERAGGVARVVKLTPPDWRVTRDALEAAITPRTRILLMNNPVNPTGIVLRKAELALLADLCASHDLIALCDEVWEETVYDGLPHRPLIGFPGMRERTVKIGSAGKIFSVTGWKVGWMCAAPPIATLLARAHQFLTFTTPPNLQWGGGAGAGLARRLAERSARRLSGGARSAGGGSHQGGLCRAAQRRHLVPVDRPARVRHYDRRCDLLQPDHRRSGGCGDPDLRLLSRRSGHPSGPPLLLQVGRDAGSGDRAARRLPRQPWLTQNRRAQDQHEDQ